MSNKGPSTLILRQYDFIQISLKKSTLFLSTLIKNYLCAEHIRSNLSSKIIYLYESKKKKTVKRSTYFTNCLQFDLCHAI